MDPTDRIRKLIAAHLALRTEGRSPTLESLVMRAWGEAQGHGYSLGFKDGEKTAGDSDVVLVDCWSKLAAREGQIGRLRQAIHAALEAAADEGVHRYRGTDEPRAFVVILREALRGQDAPPADEEGTQGAVGGEGGEPGQGGENQS